MNGAESLVRSLLASDVEVCFTNPGTSEMHFVAALDSVPGMRCVLGLFEGVVTGAADGYARMRGTPAATLLHLGPGLGNGLANLHNARKATSPVVNVVGEHALDHLRYDTPLTSDIEGIARPVSDWVRTSRSAASVGADGAAAVQAARTPPGGVATLILPADTAWNAGGAVVAARTPPGRRCVEDEKVHSAARALRAGGGLLLLGGDALLEDGLRAARRIAAATGCAVLAEGFNARIRRGQGQPAIDRVPYPVAQARAMLAPYREVVLAGSVAPVAFFGYPDQSSELLGEHARVTGLAGRGDEVAEALERLADALGAPAAPPRIASRERPGAPSGAVTKDGLGALVARAVPENGIVVDEAVTTGRAFFPLTHAANPHDWLQNRGGSIGFALPVATGAAIACPDRKVLVLEGDGSGMYTVQSLWTQAREGLDVTTLVFANRSYAILHGELEAVGAGSPGPRARDMLDLDRPPLDWCGLARAMGVEAERVDSLDALEQALGRGLASPGPYLVEVVM